MSKYEKMTLSELLDVTEEVVEKILNKEEERVAEDNSNKEKLINFLDRFDSVEESEEEEEEGVEATIIRADTL